LKLDNQIEKITNYSFSNQKIVKEGTSDLLKNQLVEKVPICPNSMQSNNVLVNPIIGVSF
jgi:hypothetical protein